MRTDVSIPLHVTYRNMSVVMTRENAAGLIVQAIQYDAIFYYRYKGTAYEKDIPLAVARDVSDSWLHTSGIEWWTVWRDWSLRAVRGYELSQYKDKQFIEELFTALDKGKQLVDDVLANNGYPSIQATLWTKP